MMRSFFVLISISVFLYTVPAHNTAIASTDSSTILVGSEPEFPPYAFVDKNGNPAGFSVDLMQAVAEAMGLTITISVGPWNAVWEDLVNGRIDVLPIVAKLPDRTRMVDFSLPHTETYDAFFVRKGESLITNLTAARDKEIVVMRADAAHHALLELNFQGRLITVETIPEGLALVAAGNHDAFLCSKLIGTMAVNKHGIKGLTAGPLVPDYKRIFSFAVKKGDDVLLEKLNQGLLIIKTNGVYDRIYEQWLSADDPWRKFTKYLLPAAFIVMTCILIGSLWVVILQMQVKKRTRELDETNTMLHQAREELEERVEQRTKELSQANRNLETEIAERKQAEKERERLVVELARSNEELEQFAYMASHDLKEPLRTVINFAQLLQKRYRKELDEKACQYMDFIVGGSQRMQKLIEGLLAYSRIDQKKEGLETFPANEAFDVAVANLIPVIKENRAKVTRDELPVIVGDELQFVQLLQNLISNGVKYRQPGISPRVHISAGKENGAWTFVVRDNGIGIEQQHFDRIFQIFQRLHSHDEYPGTGIGLALCKRIVERHHGRIWLESSPGRGTKFFFTIPIS